MEYSNKQSSFLIYKDWEALFDSLENDEEAGKLIKALFRFVNRGEKPAFRGALKTAFIFMSQQISRDSEKWENSREKRSQYMKDKWQKKKSTIVDYGRLSVTDTGTVTGTGTVIGTVTGTGTVIGTVTNKERESSEQSSPPTPPPRFKKPTLEAVKAYCEERGNVINADKFYDYYESNGWIVGRTKMKDWKAAVRRWEQTEYDNSSNTNTEPELTQGEGGFFYDKNGDRYI